MSDENKDLQLEQILNDLRKKREDPYALKLNEIEKDLLATNQFAPEAEPQPASEESVCESREEPRRAVEYEIPSRRSVTSEISLDRIESTKSEKRITGEIAKRDIMAALNAAADPGGDDPINKSMVSPSIAQANQQEPVAHVFSEEPQAEREGEQRHPKAENHPVFIQQITREILIPGEEKGEKKLQSGQFSTSEFIMDGYVQRGEKKGVLNVRDNLDDNFREFFGDTILIDKEPLSKKKTRKLKDFVLADSGDELGVPVFEDDVEQQEVLQEREYRSDEQTDRLIAVWMKQSANAALRLAVTGVMAALMVTLSVLAQFFTLPALIGGAEVFYFINAAAVVVAVAVNGKQVFTGLLKLVAFRANGESLISFAAITALIEAVALVLDPAMVHGTFGSVVLLAMFFSCIGTLMNARRILNDLRAISGDYDKYASSVLDDRKFSQRVARNLKLSAARVLLKRRTGFTDDFLALAESEDLYSRKTYIVGSISVFVSLACALYTYIRGDGFTEAAIALCGAAALCLPFAATMTSAFPIYRMHRRLSRVGAVIPGYDAVEEVCDANCVVLEGRELFPKGNVMLHGIKTFERERIDTAIIFAASVIIQSCDTMSPMFVNVIQGKTEMLCEVDGVEYEPELGFSYWIDRSRVLLGTRRLMQEHDIDIPSQDYESRYTKTNTRDAIYLAVAGKLYAMFVVSYTPNPEVAQALLGFEREGVNILIHTRDFNINADRVSRLYGIPQNMISIVQEQDAVELTHRTDYASHAPSVLTHIGTLISFVKGIGAGYSVRSCVRTASVMELICMILGAVLALAMSYFDAFSAMGILPVLAFQAIWLIIICATILLRRY